MTDLSRSVHITRPSPPSPRWSSSSPQPCTWLTCAGQSPDAGDAAIAASVLRYVTAHRCAQGQFHEESVMPVGPVEYVLIGFPENNFSGEIAPALSDLIASETIRIIDLVFISKDADGTVTTFEYDALDETIEFGQLPGEAGGFLGEDDITEAAEQLDPNTSAALLVWEDTWATPFAVAVRNAGGVILGGERIPHEIVEAFFEEVAATD